MASESLDCSPPKSAKLKSPPIAGTRKGKRSVAHRQPQGQSAGTVLTNRSKSMTVITPLDDRKSVIAPSLSKGTRWMHRSTITMERNPQPPDFTTSAQESYNGNKMLPGARRPTVCPTLHSSHFDIGLNKKLYHSTHYKSHFPHHDVDHPNKLHHQSITNWTHNVRGSKMHDVLSREGHSADYWSSYAHVHNRLGLQRGEGVSRARQPLPSYNILTGHETGTNTDRDLHLISGNRVLHSVRQIPEQSLILQ
nr:uncharacterized protein LOC129269422 [Lytechinus pictus]